jgi:hypothetical protein
VQDGAQNGAGAVLPAAPAMLCSAGENVLCSGGQLRLLSIRRDWRLVQLLEVSGSSLVERAVPAGFDNRSIP